MSNFTSLTLVLISIVCVTSYHIRHSRNTNTCNAMPRILCMKDELLNIKKQIGTISIEIEKIKAFVNESKALLTLSHSIENELFYTKAYLPQHKKHEEFFLSSNIDKKFLTELFVEAHDAMVFYYNSIKHLLSSKNDYSQNIDRSFDNILANTLFHGLICGYRNALYVFSEKWKSLNEIDRIHFSGKHYGAPSTIHEVHSMVIVKHFEQWLVLIDNVIANLDRKVN